MHPRKPPLWIEIAGFKALREPARLDLRPLTLLAGANSSGKSSVMQPLLLLKQTLEASFDAGPLLLDGPHAQFTWLDQIFTQGGSRALKGPMVVRWGPQQGTSADELPMQLSYRRPKAARKDAGLAPPDVALRVGEDWVAVRDGAEVPAPMREVLRARVTRLHAIEERVDQAASYGVLELLFKSRYPIPHLSLISRTDGGDGPVTLGAELLSSRSADFLRTLLHIPGLRGHRDRTFPAARVLTDRGVLRVQGPFLDYVASTVLAWQEAGDPRLQGVGADLARLGVTSALKAQRLNAVAVQIKVGRTLSDDQPDDLVDIADVGFGVSTALPVVVALAAAVPGQMVYIEQPELHLHPRAQLAMGHLLAGAAARGVFVVVETHSQLILRAIQASVAAPGGLSAADLALHWFTRDPATGFARVTRADVDESGAFGAWPIDFSEVESQADEAWLRHLLGAAEP